MIMTGHPYVIGKQSLNLTNICRAIGERLFGTKSKEALAFGPIFS